MDATAPQQTVLVSKALPALTIAFSLAVLGALGLLVSAGYAGLDVFDPRIVELRSTTLDPLLDALDIAGRFPVWPAVVTLIAIVLRRGWRGTTEALSVVVVTELATTATKAVFARERPPGADVGDLIVAAGFPSGHVTRTAVLVGIVLFLIGADPPRRRLIVTLGVVLVMAMAIARVSADAHYTSDVLGALLLSATILAGWDLVSRVPASIAPIPRLWSGRRE